MSREAAYIMMQCPNHEERKLREVELAGAPTSTCPECGAPHGPFRCRDCGALIEEREDDRGRTTIVLIAAPPQPE